MNTYYLSDSIKGNLMALLEAHKYDESKSMIMDLKKQLHVLYAEIERSEKEYINSKQLKLF